MVNAEPVNAAFDQACRRRRPGSCTAAAASFAPIARAPSSPRTGISLKWKSAPPATAPSHLPEQVEQHRAAQPRVRERAAKGVNGASREQ
jgi:hypothetical protein